MRLIVPLLASLIVLGDVAHAARWHWPWEFGWHHRSYTRHSRHRKEAPRAEQDKRRPDCTQIKDALKALPPEKLIRALNSSSRAQRKTIEDCTKGSQQ